MNKKANPAVAATTVAVAKVQYEHRCCEHRSCGREGTVRRFMMGASHCIFAAMAQTMLAARIMMVNAPSHVLEKDLACTQISDGPFPVHLRSGGTDMLPARIMKAKKGSWFFFFIMRGRLDLRG